MGVNPKPRLHRGNNVQYATCRTLLHVSFCRKMGHATTCGKMLHASRLFTPKHQIFLIEKLGIDMSLTTTAAEMCETVSMQ
jgi:hypothetical protein